MKTLPNLTGSPKADSVVVRELLAAGIDIVPDDDDHGEVPTTFHGRVNHWVFHRAWYYWVARPVVASDGLPIERAQPLWESLGEEVRAGGDCGCREPEVWATRYTEDKVVVVDPKGEQQRQIEQMNNSASPMHIDTDQFVFVKNPDDVEHTCVVSCYHIDTLNGLIEFAKVLKDETARSTDTQTKNSQG